MRRKEGILSPPGSHQLSLAQAHRVPMPEPGTGCGRRSWFPASKTRSTGERNPGGQLEEAARAGRGAAQEPPVTLVWSPAQAGATGSVPPFSIPWPPRPGVYGASPPVRLHAAWGRKDEAMGGADAKENGPQGHAARGPQPGGARGGRAPRSQLLLGKGL